MANKTGKGGFGDHKEHIWRKGTPENFGEVRKMAVAIAHEIAIDKAGQPMVVNGHVATNAEIIFRKWLQSQDPKLQMKFIAYAFGEVPAKQENMNIDLSSLTDEQLQMLKDGKDLLDVLKHPGA